MKGAVWQFEDRHVTHQTYYRHEKAGAPGAANPALPLEYVSARLRGQVTKVAIRGDILIAFPQREYQAGNCAALANTRLERGTQVRSWGH